MLPVQEFPRTTVECVDTNDLKIRSAARFVLNLLTQKDYASLSDLTAPGPVHLNADDIQRTIESYPATIRLPEESELVIDVVELENSFPRQYSVDVAVFTVEEGRSDLTVRMIVTDNPDGGYAVVFYDVLVM